MTGTSTAAQTSRSSSRSKPPLASGAVLQKIGAARAAGLTHGAYEGNELQLPAVFLLDSGRKVLCAHYGATPADVPTVDEMADWLGHKEVE